MAKNKEYTIEAIGRYFAHSHLYNEQVAVGEYPIEVAKEQATKAIQDMLRYDNGTVVYLDVLKENHSFTAIIKSRQYTKGRWDSFGIRTREVNWESYNDDYVLAMEEEDTPITEVKIQWNV